MKKIYDKTVEGQENQSCSDDNARKVDDIVKIFNQKIHHRESFLLIYHSLGFNMKSTIVPKWPCMCTCPFNYF